METDPKSRYYDAGGIELIEIIRAKLTPEQFRGYLLGNAIKYSGRLNFKGSPERDAEKLAYYSKWLNEEMKCNDTKTQTTSETAGGHHPEMIFMALDK